jgi:hypothetical protein
MAEDYLRTFGTVEPGWRKIVRICLGQATVPSLHAPPIPAVDAPCLREYGIHGEVPQRLSAPSGHAIGCPDGMAAETTSFLSPAGEDPLFDQE